MALTHQFIADEEGGPAVGVVYDLSNGDQVWSGEVSRDLWNRQSAEAHEELVNDYGTYLVHAVKGGDVDVLARVASVEAGIELAAALAHWIEDQKLERAAIAQQRE